MAPPYPHDYSATAKFELRPKKTLYERVADIVEKLIREALSSEGRDEIGIPNVPLFYLSAYEKLRAETREDSEAKRVFGPFDDFIYGPDGVIQSYLKNILGGSLRN